MRKLRIKTLLSENGRIGTFACHGLFLPGCLLCQPSFFIAITKFFLTAVFVYEPISFCVRNISVEETIVSCQSCTFTCLFSHSNTLMSSVFPSNTMHCKYLRHFHSV